MLFLACSVTGYFIDSTLKIIAIIIAALSLIFTVILAALRYRSSDNKNLFLTLILSFAMITLSLVSSFNYYDRSYEKYAELYASQCMVEATVIDVNYENTYASKYEISVNALNGQADDYKAYLECEYSGALRAGDRIAVNAVATELPQENSGKFNEKAEAISNSIFVIFTSDSQDQLSVIEYTDGKGLGSVLTGINERLSGVLTDSIGGEEGNLGAALLLGNKNLLSNRTERDFRRVGASHILALSGMHMSIIMGFAMFLLRHVFRKRSIVITILSCFAIFYLALTGFSISATRSVIMLLMVYVAFLVSGVPDSLTALSVAGFLIVITSPGAILDAGFWLSFSATLGILVYVSALNDIFQDKFEKCKSKRELKIRKLIYSVISAIVTCFAALIPLIIVMCIFIKEFSVLSVLSSLVLSIPTAGVIILSLLLLPLFAVPYVGVGIAWAIRNLAALMIGYCSKMSELEDIVCSLNYPFATTMAIILGAALLYSFVSNHKRQFLSLIPFLACLAVLVGVMTVYEHINKDNLNVAYINSAQRSDIIVLSDEREVVICDLSNGSKKAYNLALTETFESRATEIDAIIMTRYTNAHISTYHSVLAQNRVRGIWAPYPENDEEHEMLERLYHIAEQNGVAVYVYKSGDRFGVFDHVVIEHSRDYIDRSVVPIDLVGIFTGKENLTYISSAYSESELCDKAEYYISESKYVIFGGRGPTVKQKYTIESAGKLKAIAFANEELIGLFEKPDTAFISYYLVPPEGEMEFYLDE